MKYHLTLVVCFSIISFGASAQSIVGKWKTIDDETGKPRSVVQIEERDGLVYGRIIELFRSSDEDPDPVCDECPGDRKGQKIIGMEIISGMQYDTEDAVYEDGEILDPESGSVYDCKLWVGDEGNLMVRGYVAFFFRTQTWLPYGG